MQFTSSSKKNALINKSAYKSNTNECEALVYGT